MAVARESWGPDCSLISRPHQRASFAASTQAGRTQHYAQVSKGLPIDVGQSLAVLSMRGSEPHGSAGLRKPVPRAFSFSCLFFFFLYSFILDILSMPFARLRLEVASISH